MVFSNGCSDSSASAVNFPCSQPVPAPMPNDMPSTAIAHAFPGDGFFSSNASSNVDQSLALIDAYLACLGDVCSAAGGSILLGNGTGFDLVPLLQTIQDQINALLSNGEILLGSPNGAIATSLCDEIENCLGQLLITNEMVLMNSANGLIGVDFCAKTFSCMNNASADGQFFLNIGGVVQAADFAAYVSQYLGSTDCTAVIQCLVQSTQAGEVLYNDGTNIIGVDLLTTSSVIADPAFCNGVQGCILPLIAPGQVLGNVGGVLSSVPLPTVPDPGPTFTCTDVFNCLDANSTNGSFFLNQNGDVVATNFEAAVLAIAGNTGTNFTCANVLPCLDALTSAGQILYDNGTGLAPTNFSSLLPSAGTTSFFDLTDVASPAGNENGILALNSTGTAVEFIKIFSEYGAISLSGAQTLPTGQIEKVSFNNQISFRGGITPGGTQDEILLTSLGTYLIVWQVAVEGLIDATGGELVDIRVRLDQGNALTPITLQRDRHYYDSGVIGTNYAGSGSITKGLPANTPISLELFVGIDSGANYNFTILDAHLSVYRIA